MIKTLSYLLSKLLNLSWRDSELDSESHTILRILT